MSVAMGRAGASARSGQRPFPPRIERVVSLHERPWCGQFAKSSTAS